MSFFRTDFISYEFVGIRNYVRIFTDSRNLQSIVNTIIYTIVIVSVDIVLATSISLGFYHNSNKTNDVLRTVYYIPTLTAGIIIASFYKWLFSGNGGVNHLLSLVGMSKIQWMGSGYTAMSAICFILITQNIGGIIVMISASVIAIDKNMIEASKIDGCTDRQTKWLIMFPQIIGSVLTMVFLGFIGVFQMFETIYLVAPYEYSASIMFRVYETAFQNGKYGEGSALSVLLVGVVLSLTMMAKKIQK